MGQLKWTGERLVTSVESEYFMYEHLHRYALAREICGDKTVLDIACGEGYGTYLLSGVARFVYGVDIDPASIDHAADKYAASGKNISFIAGSAAEIPLDESLVDVVISFETIEHLDAHEQMMKEIKRVLKPGGLLMISSPDKTVYKQLVPNNPFHVRELEFAGFRELLSRYFRNRSFYQQCFVAGSLITPVDNKPAGFALFDGDYTTVSNQLPAERYFNKYYYNLAICSDDKLPAAMNASLFNGVKAVINNQDKMLQKGREQITKSTSFRLGNWIVSKFSFLKKIKG